MENLEAENSNRVADALAKTFVAMGGVPFAFGVCGGEVLTLIDAFENAGVRYLTARHENAAGFMAEGTHHVLGGPGLLIATLGPGVANAINVTANALQDNVPMIVLGGRRGDTTSAAFTHQIIDQAALFRPVTKAVMTLSQDKAADQMQEAMTLAMAEPRGPVYIDCPSDIAKASYNHEVSVIVEAEGLPDTSVEDCRALAENLVHAKRPLVLAGLNALRPGVEKSLTRLIEQFQLPLLTTYKAKGLVPESHPFVLGGAGLSPKADRILLPFVKNADLVLLVGYDPVEVREPWVAPFASDAKVIDLSQVSMAESVATEHVPVGTLKLTLDQIVDAGRDDTQMLNREDIAETRTSLQAAFAVERDEWSPGKLFATASHVLGDEARVAVDTGAHRILLAQQWAFEQPKRLVQSSGFCTMACALPLAIGMKLADPQSDVVAIVGDGGLEVGLGDLATLRDTGLSLPVIVVDDSSFALIDMKQRAMELKSCGVSLGATDFASLARSIGGRGQRVENDQEFEAALREALSSTEFTVIHAPFKRGAYDGRI